MREIDVLCTLIKCTPKSMVDLDWAEETDGFDIPRMHELVLKLNDIDLINSVITLIVAEWDLLESQDDPRCYKLSDKGKKVLKFPDSTDYSDGPHYNSYPSVSTQSISGVLYLCKEEVMRKMRPILKHQKVKEQLLEKYSQPTELKQRNITETLILPAPVTLTFFDNNLYSTTEEQQSLRVVLQAELNNIDKTNGHEWFAYYAAYRYVKKLRGSKKNYVDFFFDIEKLLPDALPKLNPDKQGDKRYKHYTLQIANEVEKWYVDANRLPPINSLIWEDYHFRCSEETFKKMSIIIKRLFSSLHSLEEKLKSEKGVIS